MFKFQIRMPRLRLLAPRFDKDRVRQERDFLLQHARLLKPRVPGVDDAAKKQWLRQKLTGLVEISDGQLPILGPFMDMPDVDAFQARLIEEAVEAVWRDEK